MQHSGHWWRNRQLEWRVSSPFSTTCSVTAAEETQSTTLPLGEGWSVAFPPPELEIVQVVPEPELSVDVGDRPTTRHLEETVLYSVDDYYTVQPVTPSLSVSGSERRELTTEVIHTTVVPPIGSLKLYTEQVPSLYTRSPSFYNIHAMLNSDVYSRSPPFKRWRSRPTLYLILFISCFLFLLVCIVLYFLVCMGSEPATE